MPSPSNLETALVAILNASSSVTALIAGRIDAVRGVKTYTAPYIVFQQMPTGPQPQVQESAAGLHRFSFQLDCYASDYDTARDLAIRVVSALHGYRGTISGIFIQHTQAEHGPDLNEDGSKIFRKIVEVQFKAEGPLS